ncbi:MAG: 2-oxo acid dehydrogenase subunit E2 [Chloroflexi bacterium]|nr:2-oxo acid dehydrogenase subunit E2 [Chloroflexota bacterium]MCI0869161.1 2-oxo acid dehydrogenase subunit E2 [Chloroflexota bacterium]
MATEVLLPQWGMNMEDGLMVKWLVQEGDTVQAGQPLVEVETAKINSELESPVTGIVAHIMAREGATVDVGTLVAVIAEPGETVPRPSIMRPAPPLIAPRRSASPVASSSTPGNKQVTPVARRLAANNNLGLDSVEGTGPNGRITEDDVRRAIEERNKPRLAVQVVPGARLLARQHGIDLNDLEGSGPNGRILVVDVEGVIAEGSNALPTREVIPLRGLRKTIADRMLQSSRGMAQVTLTTEADVTEMVRLREALVSEWRSDRIRPLDLDIIVKAVADTLAEHPRLNATLVKDEVRILQDVNVGLAMAVPNGLLVPVIRNADAKGLQDIAVEIRALAERSRMNELSVDDMIGAGFTITSLSNYDVDAFTPIIDPPQVAILGVGRVREKPAVHRGEIAIRSMMFLSLAFDHRALDGVPAGEFLQAVSRRLEDTSWLAAPSLSGGL